ncbi:pirin family protein [Flavobacteriaceae bacterium]|nr:pirin family protein [Flavobacteriaceae bacterium]
MKTILHTADSRGTANHGWLQSHHTFSFAGYHHPERHHFGVLRVLNDDTVAGGMGFGTHPHRDMEIISIPLEGDLKHQDNTGTAALIKHGDVQVMSAGRGIEHSEYNANADKTVKFLQIWVIPKVTGVPPRYQQISLKAEDRKNKLQQILSPNSEDQGVWIHQDAWFHLGSLDKGKALKYQLKDPQNNGVYAFVVKGSLEVAGSHLTQRDGLGITDTHEFDLKASEDSEILLMELPMGLPRV